MDLLEIEVSINELRGKRIYVMEDLKELRIIYPRLANSIHCNKRSIIALNYDR